MAIRRLVRPVAQLYNRSGIFKLGKDLKSQESHLWLVTATNNYVEKQWNTPFIFEEVFLFFTFNWMLMAVFLRTYQVIDYVIYLIISNYFQDLM